MHLVPIVAETKSGPLREPIFQRERDLAEVLLSEHAVLVPDDNLDCTEPIGEGEINGKIKGSIFQPKHWVCIALDDGGVVPRIQQGDDDEARKAWNEMLFYGGTGVAYGSQELCLLREQRSLQPRTCRRSRTTGCSPGEGEKVLLPLPRPPETRAGKRAAVLRARPIFWAFLGTGGSMERVRGQRDNGTARRHAAPRNVRQEVSRK